MGAALYPVFKEPIEAEPAIVDGKCLARNYRRLARAAKELRVQPLSAFEGMGVAAFADLLGMDPVDLDIPADADASEQWFSAAEGLRTVRALLGWVRSNPGSLKDQEGVTMDLLECERQLALADARGILFHFAWDC